MYGGVRIAPCKFKEHAQPEMVVGTKLSQQIRHYSLEEQARQINQMLQGHYGITEWPET